MLLKLSLEMLPFCADCHFALITEPKKKKKNTSQKHLSLYVPSGSLSVAGCAIVYLMQIRKWKKKNTYKETIISIKRWNAILYLWDFQ